MSELNLKSPTKQPERAIVMVRTNDDVQFFGVHGRQISATMSGMHLHWNGDVVVVRNDNFPGQERWVFPANISDIHWKTT